MLQQRGDGHRLRVLQALPFADVASASIDGDEVAFTVLYQRFRSELIRRAQRLGSDDPEGVADEVLVGGITALRRLDALEETQFRQYLHRSVRNRVIDEARRGQRRVSMDLVGDVGDIEREFSAITTHEVALGDRLSELLTELTEAEREVVLYRVLAGYSSAEVADRVGRSPSAVRQLQAKAFRKLRRLGPTAFGILAMIVIVASVFLANRSASIDTGPADDRPVAPVEQDRGRLPSDGDSDSDSDGRDDEEGAPGLLPSGEEKSEPTVDGGASDLQPTRDGAAPVADPGTTRRSRQASPTTAPPIASSSTVGSTTTAASPTTSTPETSSTVDESTTVPETGSSADPVATDPPTLPPAPTCDGLAATIVGTPESDSLMGTDGQDVIVGGAGDDTIQGLGGDDVICGGDGNDQLFGGDGSDVLFGEGGNDIVNGGPGHDFLSGGPGSNDLWGMEGNDTCIGGYDYSNPCEFGDAWN